MLSEVNVHGLHNGILGGMTEEVPRGERLVAAISLSVLPTTCLSQQMAPMLKHRRCEELRGMMQHKDVQIPNQQVGSELSDGC